MAGATATRLFLYRGPSKYSLTGIDDEYTIEWCEHLPAICRDPPRVLPLCPPRNSL